MKLIFMGTPDFSVLTLDALIASGHEVVAVYTQPPRPAGRGKNLRFSPVHQRALGLNIPVETPLNFKDTQAIETYQSYQADAAIVVAYGLILPPAILSSPSFGCLNIHASLLPRWRGAAPIQRAIMAADPYTGVCIMQMESGLDTGPVLMSEKISIPPEDTAGQLHDKLSELGARLCVQTLDKLDALTSVPQAQDGITYAHKIEKSEARINWTQPAQHIARQICGLSPFPGAWCMIGNERVKLLEAKVTQGHGTAGDLLEGGLKIACGVGAIEITSLQRAGKKALPTHEALHGLNLSAGIH